MIFTGDTLYWTGDGRREALVYAKAVSLLAGKFTLTTLMSIPPGPWSFVEYKVTRGTGG